MVYRHIHGVYASMKHAWNGFVVTAKEEKNFKIESVIIVTAILLGLYLGLPAVELAIIVLAGGSVLALEMMNTAIEETWDKLSPERDPAVGRIKDISAGAVFLIGISAFVTGILIFAHHLFVL
jgi:diacylglycerol kinase